MENTNQMNEKMMTEKQKDYIERLLLNQRIDEKYRRYVERALQNTVSCQAASKIIDFLINFIEFKKNFVRIRNGNNSNSESFRKANFENIRSKDTNQHDSKNIKQDEIVTEHVK